MLKYIYLFMMFICSTVMANEIALMEKNLHVRIGYAIYDAETSRSASYNAQQPFPLMSTFKTFACAKLLRDGTKTPELLQQEHIITQDSLIPWSPVTEKRVGEKISMFDACEATMLTSDNTAVNIVLAQIGGSDGITQFFRDLGDQQSRLDRVEPELNQAAKDDVRDTTTPLAMNNDLRRLYYGKVLSESAKETLFTWMTNNTVSDPLIRSFLPKTWTIADRSGAGGNGSRGLTAIMWKENRKPIFLTIYITQSKLEMTERNKLINDIAKIAFKEIDLSL